MRYYYENITLLIKQALKPVCLSFLLYNLVATADEDAGVWRCFSSISMRDGVSYSTEIKIAVDRVRAVLESYEVKPVCELFADELTKNRSLLQATVTGYGSSEEAAFFKIIKKAGPVNFWSCSSQRYVANGPVIFAWAIRGGEGLLAVVNDVLTQCKGECEESMACSLTDVNFELILTARIQVLFF